MNNQYIFYINTNNKEDLNFEDMINNNLSNNKFDCLNIQFIKREKAVYNMSNLGIFSEFLTYKFGISRDKEFIIFDITYAENFRSYGNLNLPMIIQADGETYVLSNYSLTQMLYYLFPNSHEELNKDMQDILEFYNKRITTIVEHNAIQCELLPMGVYTDEGGEYKIRQEYKVKGSTTNISILFSRFSVKFDTILSKEELSNRVYYELKKSDQRYTFDNTEVFYNKVKDIVGDDYVSMLNILKVIKSASYSFFYYYEGQVFKCDTTNSDQYAYSHVFNSIYDMIRWMTPVKKYN